jgi:FkbM family methyltransferase
MDRLELRDRWDTQRNRSALTRIPRWLSRRMAKQLVRWTGKPQKRETKLFWGQPMTIVYPEFVSGKIGRFGYFETDQTSMFIDVLRPGMTVYDVGSHFGYFSLLASELVGDSGHVFAFEPTLSTFNVLKENASRRENVTCKNLAAYCETGEITFMDQGLHDCSLNFIVGDEPDVDTSTQQSSAKLIKVPAVKLDEFAEDNGYPDFVKIDAEGSEATILEGMTKIIQRCHPGISLEMSDQVCERTGNQPSGRNIEFLMDHGYEVFDYQSCQPRRHDVKRSYVYDNLLFRHREWQAAAHAVA